MQSKIHRSFECKLIPATSYRSDERVHYSNNWVMNGILVRVVFVHLIFIQYWKLKIKTSQSCFSMFDSSKIYNLNFQCLLLRKVKLNIILQYFENQKLKIENGQLVVLTFCFQFPLPKIQAIKNSKLTKQFMCNGVTAGWNPK